MATRGASGPVGPAATGDPYPVADWPLGRLLSTAARLVEHDWNLVLARYDLTHAGLVVLTALGDGPRTQRELAAASRVEQQTMTRVLTRLERTGHVERVRDDADRRRRIVTLTDHGRRALATVARSDLAERLVSDRVDDPVRLRAELVRLLQPADVSTTPARHGRPPAPAAADGPADGAGAPPS